MAEMFQDREGNTSSKRVVGAWCVGVGTAALVTVAVNSVLYPGDYKTALEAAEFLFGGGLGILGVSVAEFFGRKSS